MAMTPVQIRNVLLSCGVGARYADFRISKDFPSMLKPYDRINQIIADETNLIIEGPNDIGALVFSAALALLRKDLFAVETAMMLHYLENNDAEKLSPIYNCEILTLLSFCSAETGKASPYTQGQTHKIESFVRMMINQYDKTVIIRTTDETLPWFSKDFRSFYTSNVEVVKSLQ